MPSRVRFFVLAAVLWSLGAARPVHAITRYAFSATIAEGGTSFGLGTSIEFIGLLTDPSLVPGESPVSLIETATLSIGGVVQSDVEASVRLGSPPNRLDLFTRFTGVNNPDISIVVDLPRGIEAEFPESEFDLADVALVTAEINEDGILPKNLDLTAFSATAWTEHVVDGGFDDPAHPAWNFEKYDTSSTIAWDSEDAGGSLASGSLSLDKAVGENPNSLRASQCIALVADAQHALSGNLFWPSTSTEGNPYLLIAFYAQPGCQGGDLGGVFASIGFPPRDEWTAIAPTFLDTPSGTVSALVYAGVVVDVNLGSPNFFAASWDDVSVVPEPGSAAAIAAFCALGWLTRRRAAARR